MKYCNTHGTSPKHCLCGLRSVPTWAREPSALWLSLRPKQDLDLCFLAYCPETAFGLHVGLWQSQATFKEKSLGHKPSGIRVKGQVWRCWWRCCGDREVAIVAEGAWSWWRLWRGLVLCFCSDGDCGVAVVTVAVDC